jgi:selenocysteine lyase/cysteine desulfurase
VRHRDRISRWHKCLRGDEAAADAHVNVSTTVPEHNQFDTELRGIHPLVRLSPHYYNTEDEIDRTLEAFSRIAD